ncbi:KGGVGR-motif variant AAA ATPase [Sphingobacterium ginsenosidimutans]|uniref:AAA domain-containing protein n=1 Tax=Sphingobacterium ginsenosidimutans TaxID=687845 RepID=A0ABP7ZW90_9SPHI
MKTITFYSYKGGVGRSLALSNIAIKLSQLKKKVFVIDFDLEAPGLQFKFDEDYSLNSNDSNKGLVDYIHSFANENILPENLATYTCKLKAKNINDNNIDFLSAGNFENDEYWRKLATMKWSQLFYSRNSHGIRFFLDLKAKIEKDFAPDYLLIDSRTGITDISGITLKIFADEIVLLAVNNTENLFGTKKIITSLTSPKNELLNHNPKIHFILTRLPFPKEAEDKAYEYSIIKRWEKELIGVSNGKIKEISIIHTDKQVHRKEIVKIGSSSGTNTITYDYLKLFEKLTEDNLDEKTDLKFEAVKKAENFFNKALMEKDTLLQLEYLNEAINLDPSRHEYFMRRGYLLHSTNKFDEALQDYKEALKIKPNDPLIFFQLGNLHYSLGDYTTSLEYLNQVSFPFDWLLCLQGMALEKLGKTSDAEEKYSEGIDLFPTAFELLNGRANLLRKQKRFDEAYSDIYKAIEIDPDQGFLFATLAEINLESGKKDDFYLNLNVALSKNTNVSQLNTAKEVYQKVKDESRFLQLLEKYQISLDDLFQ